ncbi:hypothetical protein ACQ7HM_09110 [Williamsia sp. MIQD14]|uniref:hypothetical protein n=1 Tax=Williamsia sp. MIQD14 TaxID=3425703 RepID=UPI003DA06D51
MFWASRHFGGVAAMTDRPDGWILSTRELLLAWKAADGIDFPLCLSSGDPERYDDGDHARKVLSQIGYELEAAMTPSKRAAMSAFTRPRYSLAVSGLDASRSHEEGSHYIRMYAAWSGGDTGYIASQKALPDPNLGGEVTVTAHPFAQWTRSLADLLPTVEAGRLPADTAVPLTTFIVADREIPIVDTSADRNSAATAFVHRMPSTCGNITAAVGSITEGRRPDALDLRWHDIPDDGRYLLIVDPSAPTATAMPATSIEVAKMINRSLNALKQRHQAGADTART